MNVLIVDDHALNRKLLRAQLEGEGHAILEAGDGVEALAVLERDRVDAVISDILMPKLDGFGFCAAVRRHSRLSALPFIFYTSTYTSAADMQLAQNVGASRYLAKPAPVEALIAALRDASFQGARPAPPDEAHLLRQHNGTLLQKLQDKQQDLLQTRQELERAHDRITDANRHFERTMTERTVELVRANAEMSDTLARFSTLSGLQPRCSCCRKACPDDNHRRRVEDYLNSSAATKAGASICAACAEIPPVGLNLFHAADPHPRS